ncbi:MAG TPA: serine hydrolase, partial [Polyangiales bacterium]
MRVPTSPLRCRRSITRSRAFLLSAALFGACNDSTTESDAAASGDVDASTQVHDGGADATLDGEAAEDGSASRDGGAAEDAAGSNDATLAPASDAAASEADAGAPAARPTMCNGKPLPPRALGKSPPFAVGPESAGLPAYWPTSGWRKEDPEKLGFDAAKLTEAIAFSTPEAQTQAVFVVRHGYVAAEVYSRGFSASTQHESYSMAKSVTSGLVGIALAEGKLTSLDQRVCEAYPAQWNCASSSDPRSRISIDHALNLTTGLDWKEDWRSSATGSNDALSFAMLDTVLGKQSAAEPGSVKRYSTGDPALLSGVLQKATGMSALQYAKQKIFDVIGTPGIRWNADFSGRTNTFANMYATASEFAKYGYLYLHRGAWDGEQVVPAEWVER